jgi:hypothetical protein
MVFRWKHDAPSQRPTRHLKLTLQRVTRHYSSATASVASRIEARTRIDPAGFFHKRPQPGPGLLAMSDISERPGPFADRLAIDIVGTRAANHCSKWVCVPVEGQLRKFKCVSQKLLCFSPHFVMFDDSKHGLQIPIHCVASSACLKIVPCVTDLFKPPPNSSTRRTMQSFPT